MCPLNWLRSRTECLRGTRLPPLPPMHLHAARAVACMLSACPLAFGSWPRLVRHVRVPSVANPGS